MTALPMIKMEKKKAFLINFLYYALLLCAAFVVLKYGLPLLAPFVIAFILAYLLRKPVLFLSRKLHIPQKPTAILLVLIFYSTIGLLLSLVGIRAFSSTRDLVLNLPQIYRPACGTGINGDFRESGAGSAKNGSLPGFHPGRSF